MTKGRGLLEEVSRLMGALVLAFINMFLIAIIARTVMSWLGDDKNNVYGFLINMTELVIFPIRKLLLRLRWFKGVALDVPLILTFILFESLSLLLGLYF